MNCPKCKKGRLTRLRTFVQGERVRRENRCPKCHYRPVTIEMPETSYLADLAERDDKIHKLNFNLEHELNERRLVQQHASALLYFLTPASVAVHTRKTPKKSLSANKTRKR